MKLKVETLILVLMLNTGIVTATQTTYEMTELTVNLIIPEIGEVQYGFPVTIIISNGGTGERAWYPSVCLLFDPTAFRLYSDDLDETGCWTGSYLLSSQSLAANLRPNIIGNYTIIVVASAQNADTITLRKQIEIRTHGSLTGVPVTTHILTKKVTIPVETKTVIDPQTITQTSYVGESVYQLNFPWSGIILLGIGLTAGYVLGLFGRVFNDRISDWQTRRKWE